MHTILQGRAGEMARGGDPDVLLEVLMYRLLARLVQSQWLLDILQPVIDAPKIKRKVFAQMSDDNLDFREAIKNAVRDQAHEVQTDVVGKREGRSDEVFPIFVQHIV